MRPTIPRVLQVLCLTVAVIGCEKRPSPLRLRDLDRSERTYVERFVALERARAVALVDLDTGNALLDSLARAWDDTAPTSILANLPREPRRVAALHDLLERILAAEADSLLQAPRPGRLAAPLPDPPAPRGGR